MAHGRYLPDLDYSILTKNADLIIIATPTKVTNTEETEPVKFDALPDPDPTMAKVTKTEFSVQASLKGQSDRQIILRHHRIPENLKEASKEAGVFLYNGPVYLTFDPKKKDCFLMFLRRLPSGEYEPISGQVDPRFSIKALDGYPYAKITEEEQAVPPNGP